MSDSSTFNQRQIVLGKLLPSHLTSLTRLWQKHHGLHADGRLTNEVITSLRNVENEDTDPSIFWETFDGPLVRLPKNRSEVYKIFGDPSDGRKVSKAWYRENIRTYRKDHALPGVNPRRYVKLHKLAEPYVREALRRAQQASDYKIHAFGDFVYRHQRHDPRRPLSYHSFGIAFDINPKDNKAQRFKSKLAVPPPWSPDWMKIWPNGMDRAFVEAIESVGFRWGGRWKPWTDKMHFELIG